MTAFDACLPALRRAGPPQAFFETIDRALSKAVGYRLLTLLYVSPNGRRVKRLHTTSAHAYPLAGYKEVTPTPWQKRMIIEQRPWVGFNADDIEWAFFDHELIASLGCQAALTLPVVYAGRVLGIINLLAEAGRYKETDVAAVEPFAALLIGPFLDAIAADPEQGR